MGFLRPPTRVNLSLTAMAAEEVSGSPGGRVGAAASARLAHERPEVRHPALGDLAHHLAHLLELLDQLLDRLNVRPGAPGDAQAARSLDQLRMAALLRGHRQD